MLVLGINVHSENLPPPILWEYEVSQRTTQKLNTTQLCTRLRWFPVILSSSSLHSGEQAVQNPTQQSEKLKMTPGVPLETWAGGPS